tara:strand:- start:660 stop:980 length:321 start_codon:yes stop_codon:yes gene_type:complete
VPKKKKVNCKETYEYNKEALLAKVKADPDFLLTKGQLMVLYPWMTGNFIKHKISKRCRNPMPANTDYGRPRFIYNQVDAYLNNPKHQEDYFKEERRSKNGKIGKIG